MKVLLWVSTLLGLASAQNNTSSTVGAGTIIIIIAILFSIFWCLICRSSSRPEIYSLLGVIIPILLIIIFIFMPKEVDRPTTTTTKDLNFATHYSFLTMGMVAFLLGSIFSCLDHFFVDKKAKNIARSAFVIKDEEEESLKRSRVMGSRQASEQMRVPTNQSN